MNEVIKVDFDTQMVSARELHERLNIKTPFTMWFDRVKDYGFTEGEEFFTKKLETSEQGGRPATDYEITIDMAKEICMIQRTEKGRQIRQYFIDLEKAWNTPELVMARALKVADRTITELKAENKTLLEDNERMKPKEVFADAVTASDSSVLVRDFAKMMRQNNVHIGEKRLYKWFRENGYICQKSTEPTQRAMEMGLFERIVRTVQKGDGLPLETQTTKITGKGQVFFSNKLIGGNI